MTTTKARRGLFELPAPAVGLMQALADVLHAIGSKVEVMARLPRREAGRRWNLISSDEATFTRLSQEPHTTILLSEDEAQWRREVERMANVDPEAYRKAVRAGKI